MNEAPLELLFGALAFLLLLSAFFSSSETGMMALNRYRLKHLLKEGHRSATRAHRLLERPDRLLGTILIGNNAVNILATSIATVVAVRLYGDAGVWITTLVLTPVILVVSEITPKTMAALHPERIAFPASVVLKVLETVLFPVLWLVTAISNLLVRVLGYSPRRHQGDDLSPEELRTVVHEARLLPQKNQGMLLNILDLERVTVNDIMIPRADVVGLDLDDPMNKLLEQIRTSEHTRLPLYQGDINEVVGILHLRNVAKIIRDGDQAVTPEALKRHAREPYFIPEGTPLTTQLLNFQQAKRRLGIVVDEYGEVMGIVTLEDLLEEIVGEFTTDASDDDDILPLEDGSYLIDGGETIREINRHLDWDLPTDGPKTLNGLAMEYLESIPDAAICFELDGYRFETVEINGKVIEKARVEKLPA